MKKFGVFLFFLLIIVFAWVAVAVKQQIYMPLDHTPANTIPPTSSSTSSGVKNTNGSIEVSAPVPNSLIRSPLTVSGQAKGLWYFEGQFPVELIDAKGTVLAKSPARALGDWMTEGFVPFSLALDFAAPTTTTGLLIFKNDNPSGDPQKDIIFAIPVRFR